jgi:hypothetical protein
MTPEKPTVSSRRTFLDRSIRTGADGRYPVAIPGVAKPYDLWY